MEDRRGGGVFLANLFEKQRSSKNEEFQYANRVLTYY